MGRLTKDAWLSGTDLEEKDIDIPELGGSVRIRALPATYSNDASSKALELKTVGRDQIATVNTTKLEILQFQHGVIEPQFSLAEVETISSRYGRAFKRVVSAIDELSGVDKEALEQASARFPGGPNGDSPGDGAPDVRVPVGPEDGDDG